MKFNFKEILKQVVPNYLWNKTKVYHKKINVFLTKKYISNHPDFSKHTNKIYLIGYPKSGNTWTRFIIYNYFTLFDKDIETTITYKELNELQFNCLKNGFKITKPPYPFLFRGHAGYSKHPEFYSLFDKILYIQRNPFDVLVSLYHWRMKRPKPFSQLPEHLHNKLADIDYFVKYHIPIWLNNIQSTVPHADAILDYDKMRYNTYEEIKPAFKKLGWEIDENKLRKAIKLSDFKSVKKMGRKTGQKYGMASDYKGEFTRKGEVGGYKNVLHPETIKWTYDNYPEVKNYYDFEYL